MDYLLSTFTNNRMKDFFYKFKEYATNNSSLKTIFSEHIYNISTGSFLISELYFILYSEDTLFRIWTLLNTLFISLLAYNNITHIKEIKNEQIKKTGVFLGCSGLFILLVNYSYLSLFTVLFMLSVIYRTIYNSNYKKNLY